MPISVRNGLFRFCKTLPQKRKHNWPQVELQHALELLLYFLALAVSQPDYPHLKHDCSQNRCA